MYIEGEIVEVKDYKVKIEVKELDGFITPFLVVPQKYTVKDKSGYMPKKGTLACAILSDDMSYGAYLGAIYNDVDTFVEENIDSDFIQYEDGSCIKHKEGSNSFNVTVENLYVSGNIIASGDIKDKKGTMQNIRDAYNNHKHSNGNNGADTGVPNSQM